MSKKPPFDSFLPSGGVDPPLRFSNQHHSHSAAVSPLSGIPRSVPMTDFMPSPQDTTPSPKTRLQSRSPSRNPPLSPPRTRSPSAENSNAALLEDWRAYTAKLRSQNEGEKAHMAADRNRVEEVMAEERALWDSERAVLKARIAELEGRLEKRSSATISPPINHKGILNPAYQAASFASPGSNAVSATGSTDGSSRGVPQESGRNADGSPFYAPAARNPSRTFDASETGGLRVDSITAPRESVIRVTSKELTSSDFIQSPSTHDLEPILEDIPDTIDISHIQAGLEGVAIKASAVSPTFAAKVLSPQFSPNKLSPDIKPPPRDITNLSRSSSNNGKDKLKNTLAVASEPENKRLTMHAGHTPNHSMSKFAWIGEHDEEDEDATPRQERPTEHIHRPSVATGLTNYRNANETDDSDNGDKALSGVLGLTNDISKDDAFLAELVEKLEEAKKSQPVGPSESNSSEISVRMEREREGEKDEGPRLKLKPSFNFGRPMGSM